MNLAVFISLLWYSNTVYMYKTLIQRNVNLMYFIEIEIQITATFQISLLSTYQGVYFAEKLERSNLSVFCERSLMSQLETLDGTFPKVKHWSQNLRHLSLPQISITFEWQLTISIGQQQQTIILLPYTYLDNTLTNAGQYLICWRNQSIVL